MQTPIDQVVRSLIIADADVAAILAKNTKNAIAVHPFTSPQSDGLPKLTYYTVTTEREYSDTRPTGKAITHIQLDAWAVDISTAKCLADSVRKAIDGYQGVVGDVYVGGIHVYDGVDQQNVQTVGGQEKQTQRVSLDIKVSHLEQVGSNSGTPIGTVRSVGVSLPGEFSVTGSPITTSGVIAATWSTQAHNTFLAAPNVDGTPSFRSITIDDFSSDLLAQLGADGGSSPVQTVVGLSTKATASTGNPIVIAGTDAGNTVRPFLTTPSGQVYTIQSETVTVAPATSAFPADIASQSGGAVTVTGSVTAAVAFPSTVTVSSPATQTVAGTLTFPSTVTVSSPATQTVAGTLTFPSTVTVSSPATQTVTGSFSTGTRTVVQGGSWTVATGPSSQTIAGSLTFPSTVTVSTVASQTVTGSLTVTAGPSSQTVGGSITTIPSGTQTVTGSLSTTPAAIQTVSGVTTTGVSFGSNNPIVIAGVDTSNTVRPFITTASGQQVVIGTITVGPATQTIAGTLTFPSTVTVTSPSTQTVNGSVTTVPSGTQTITSSSGVASILTVSPTGTELGVVVRNIPSGTQTVIGSVTTIPSGTQTVSVSNATITCTPAGSQTVNGSITVAAFPASQTVNGNITTVSNVTNGPATQTITAGTSTLSVNETSMTDVVTSTNITATQIVGTTSVSGGGTWSCNIALAAGTLTTTTFQTEASCDGINYFTVPYHLTSNGMMGGSYTASTYTTAPIHIVASANGYRLMRLNVTALTIAATTTLTVATTYQLNPFVPKPPAMAAPAFLSLATTTATTLIAAPTAPLCVYVKGIQGTNATTTAGTLCTLTVSSGGSSTANLKAFYIASTGGGYGVPVNDYWRLPAGAALMAQLGTAIQCYLGADYFVAP